MDNFFKDVDLSGLGEAPAKVANFLSERTKFTLDTIKSQSGPIFESAEKTVSIGNDALKQVIAGKLDSEGAIQIVRRSGEQLEDLARSEGNLIVVNSVSFLKKIGETVVGAFSGFLKK